MLNNNKDTARYLVSLFLTSKYSLKFTGLTSTYCSILRYIYDQMDRNYKYKKIYECDTSQNQISIYSRAGIRSVNRAIAYFVKKRMIKSESIIGQENRYKPGKLLTGYAKRCYDLRQKNKNLRHDGVPSNSFSNSSSKNKNGFDVKKPKEWTGLAKTEKKASRLLEEFIENKSKP